MRLERSRGQISQALMVWRGNQGAGGRGSKVSGLVRNLLVASNEI